jgi:hypothetical protein
MNKMLLVILAGFLLLNACSTPPNPANVKKIDEMTKKKSTETYNMTGDFTNPPPYEIGQWVMYLSEDIDGDREILKTSLVGKEDSVWVIETYRLSGNEEEVIQVGVMGLEDVRESGDKDDFYILWARVRDGEGKLDTVDGTRLMFTIGDYRDQLILWEVEYSVNNTGGPITVPAGIYNQSSKVVCNNYYILDTRCDVYHYYHGTIPINGMIKAENIMGRRGMQLIDFGMSGAKREL